MIAWFLHAYQGNHVRVVIAPDKFRGSLSAAEAAHAIARGVLRADSLAEVIEIPMADGGEGTVEALVAATRGAMQKVEVSDPLGRLILTRFGMLGDGETAVLEMAAASGLSLLSNEERDPRRTTTRGTGELLLAAIDSGAKHIILGIGGSATNDGGAGFAQAIGYRLLDEAGVELAPGGGSLDRLARIEVSNIDPRLVGVSISAACDVDNPLCGPNGAAAIFGPQKGADPATIALLDRNLAHFVNVILRDLHQDVANIPGAGAAGGLGAGLIAFANAILVPGVELVAKTVGLQKAIQGADLVITGEGAIDGSSMGGKTAIGVSRIAHAFGVPAIALVGSIGPGAEAVFEHGLCAYFSLCSRPITLETAIDQAADLLANIAESTVRLFLAGRNSAAHRGDSWANLT
jgi:glycerate kinase